MDGMLYLFCTVAPAGFQTVDLAILMLLDMQVYALGAEKLQTINVRADVSVGLPMDLAQGLRVICLFH